MKCSASASRRHACHGGTFTLTYNGQTTAAIAYNATAAQVQSALEALNNVAPGDVVVTKLQDSHVRPGMETVVPRGARRCEPGPVHHRLDQRVGHGEQDGDRSHRRAGQQRRQ